MLTLYIPTTATTGIQTDYIDLSQVASLVNRRFYRQGINWAVAGIKVLSQADYAGTITVSKLPNTWVLSNAWTKSFKAWQKLNNEALAESGSIRPKFLDFKIYADADHHQAGFAANLLPKAKGLTLGGVTGTYTAGEWTPSKFVTPNVPGNVSQGYEVVAVGGNYPGAGASGLNAVSMIEGYAASRAIPQPSDPNVPDDADDVDGITPENWMTALFQDGTDQIDEIIDDMVSENNQAPYPFEDDGTHTDTQYPGGANQGTGLEIHDFAYISGTTVGGTTYLKGGNFPCGLIRVDQSVAGAVAPVSVTLMIDLIPGNHRGYMCEPMLEM